MELSELSTFISQKRKEKKLTQNELANVCGVSTRTIVTIENGFAVDVGILKVIKILDILGYELDARVARSPLTLDELNEQNR